MNQLRADEVGDRVVNWSSKENDVLFEQPAVQVGRALSTTRLLGDIGNVIVPHHIFFTHNAVSLQGV